VPSFSDISGNQNAARGDRPVLVYQGAKTQLETHYAYC